jgi:hypothetical protein
VRVAGLIGVLAAATADDAMPSVVVLKASDSAIVAASVDSALCRT